MIVCPICGNFSSEEVCDVCGMHLSVDERAEDDENPEKGLIN